MTRLEATPAAPEEGNADQSLPDPSNAALAWLAISLLVAIAVAIFLNAAELTGRPFHPPPGDVSFSVFAGLYAGAQIIERAMEFIVPLLPVPIPSKGTATEKVAQVKADRAKFALGVTAILGVGVSCGFGLFLLDTIGINAGSNTVDSLVTGLLIGAGTKPLHDFISVLQNKNSPTTGTAATS
jgi:hypothetical protein